ncbi:MAG: rRNA maturation RNase YbeY [Actinomycetota bacterium]|nr:rRNA maturation RNase YbeY [Actinomycetota bacterium]MDA2971224.1 rRNA maturation RNase YbeY [Actinomycetota bacterium]MDA3000996.1 rRNA maturation RNase YbeY [Actinomycetota bacterium]
MTAGPPRLRRRPKVGGDGVPEVFCADEQSVVAVDVERWQTLARKVLDSEGVRGACELSVFFVAVDDMAELNVTHMGGSGPTDVLSFPIDGGAVVDVDAGGGTRGPDRPDPDPSDMPLLLGDVVICPEVADRQAATHAGSLDDEMALLVVHGVLHILGWDHANVEDKASMWTRQRELLEAHHWHGPSPETFRADVDDDTADDMKDESR